jgi:hypothetical protein
MTLEEMHATWQASNKKLVAYKILNETLIKQMISQRSQSILSIVKAKYKKLIGFLLFYMLIFAAAVVGDPFDYQRLSPYTTIFFLLVATLVFLVITVRSYLNVTRISLQHANLVETLQQTVQQHAKLRNWLVTIFMITGTLFNLAFIDRIIANRGVKDAVLYVLLLIGINVVLYYLIHKLDIFRDRNSRVITENMKELKQRLRELEELSEN